MKPENNYGSTFRSVVKSLRLPVREALLKRVGLSSYEIRIHPAKVLNSPPPADRDAFDVTATSLVSRRFDMREIGLMNVASAEPFIKQIILIVEFPPGQPILFGPSVTLRDGIEPQPKYGTGPKFIYCADYAKRTNAEGDTVELKSLIRGKVFFPFVTCIVPVFHSKIHECHYDDLNMGSRAIDFLSDDELIGIDVDYQYAWHNLNVSIALTLDDDSPMAFHWDVNKESFEPGFANIGLTA